MKDKALQEGGSKYRLSNKFLQASKLQNLAMEQ